MKEARLPSIESIPAEYWQALAEKKIFFAHMSVGYNIIDGIKHIMAQNEQIRLNIIETDDPAEVSGPIFAHTRLGHNREPDAKIESFRMMMGSISQAAPDIAFMKFCYVDIRNDSSPDHILQNYRNAITMLKQQNPNTKFLHVTVPLRTGATGFRDAVRDTIKSVIGKPGPIDDNLKRMQYNNLLHGVFDDTEPVFDLAMAESTTPEGSSCYALRKGTKVPMMLMQYTSDGGHLNQLGRTVVAEQLLITLAKLANEL
jgi:lysophospholipase L1-like esterase